MVSSDYSGMNSTDKPLSAYSSSRDVAGWTAAWGGDVTVICCAELR